MKRITLAVYIVASMLRIVSASPVDNPEASWGTASAVGLGLLFTLEPVLGIGGPDALLSDESLFTLRCATNAAIHLPAYAYDTDTGLALSALQAGSIALLWATVDPLDNNWFLGGPATLLHSQIGGMYATYEVYRHEQAAARGLDTPPGAGWCDILRSQFSPDTLRTPWVWTPAILGLGISLLTVSDDTAVWRTGEVCLGPWRFGLPAGTALLAAANLANYSMVGIGEEALYRGVIYEELSRRVGPGWAKVLDAGLIFPAVHIPQYLANGNSFRSIAMMYGLISAAGLLFDFAYDAGGVPLSAAAHMWMDFCYYTAMGLQVFGAPLGGNTGNNQTSLAEIRAGRPF